MAKRMTLIMPSTLDAVVIVEFGVYTAFTNNEGRPSHFWKVAVCAVLDLVYVAESHLFSMCHDLALCPTRLISSVRWLTLRFLEGFDQWVSLEKGQEGRSRVGLSPPARLWFVVASFLHQMPKFLSSELFQSLWPLPPLPLRLHCCF